MLACYFLKPFFKSLITGGGASLLIKEICGYDYFENNLAILALNELTKNI